MRFKSWHLGLCLALTFTSFTACETAEETDATTDAAESTDTTDTNLPPDGGPGGGGIPGGQTEFTEGPAGAGLSAAAVAACADSAAGADETSCIAQAFLDSLDETALTSASYEFSDATNRTCWSNFPEALLQQGGRPGVALGDISSDSQGIAFALAQSVLSAAGYIDFIGVLAADDYLGSSDGGNAGGTYSSNNAKIAIFGTPGLTGNWMMFIGNHHIAVLVTFVDGVGYPVPYHLAVEPRLEFTYNGSSFSPMVGDGDNFMAAFTQLSDDDKASSTLGGTINGLLLGPVEYCTGTKASVSYPTPAGITVASLAQEQQDLVTAAIEEWVRDFADYIADPLMASYTASYAETFIGWSGALDQSVQGSYLRIDGPQLWMELSVEGGIVIRDQTHYHTMYRDKTFDYGNTL